MFNGGEARVSSMYHLTTAHLVSSIRTDRVVTLSYYVSSMGT